MSIARYLVAAVAGAAAVMIAPKLAQKGRPAAKKTLKLAMVAAYEAQVKVAQAAEGLDDLMAEAKAELIAEGLAAAAAEAASASSPEAAPAGQPG
ncbi:DUF5132 domain-containing protein [Aquabacter cavernae]|uniref:DUF5132 domain-containing protein n=1 Tax=Aquabacter cavernae TaxID=2496029 RepID=UPI0013DEBD50|nr:DUF5132 domain-containing protein [Aquabacter cavernae]